MTSSHRVQLVYFGGTAPSAAESAAVFFAAKDDCALLKTNVARLIESSRRFIDFDTLSVAHFTEQRLH